MGITRRTWFSSPKQNKRFFSVFFLILSIAFSTSSPAHASRNGVLIKTNKFAVGFTYMDGSTSRVCSGSLIAPKIIVTAAHCVLSPGNIQGTDYIFSAPGVPLDAAIDPSKPRPKVAKFVVAPKYVPSTSDEVDDIAFLILDIPLATSGFIKIASAADIKSIDFTSKVAGYGFGAVYETGINYSDYVRKYALSGEELKAIPNTENMFDIGSHTAAACTGDSGGSITWVNPAGEEVLLGALSGAANIQNRCGSTMPDNLFHMRFTQVNAFVSLLGSDYNPATIFATPTPTPTAKKITIKCVKGKITKTVTGTNPKCPTGYKKK